jgi:hypothetical protein
VETECCAYLECERDIGKDAENLDHLITPERRLSVAMATIASAAARH